MAPAPTRIHRDVVMALSAQIYHALDGIVCRVYATPFDVRLPDRDEADELAETVVQPDIAVIPQPQPRQSRRKGCHGCQGPDLETRTLREPRRPGILAGPTRADRILFIFRLGADGYGKPQASPTVGPCATTTIPDLAIDWNSVFRALRKILFSSTAHLDNQ